MAWLLAVALCVQETETIPKSHGLPYQGALAEYDKALTMIEGDPKGALDAIDRVFGNARVDKKDRLIRFERANGQLTKAYEFFPNQARGKIRVALAKNDPKNAAALLASAAADFKASADAGVKPSEELLKGVKSALEKMKAVKPPEPTRDAAKDAAAEQAFREAWFKLIEDHKYKSARDYVDSKAVALPGEKRKEFANETADHCRKFVAQALDSFAKALEVNQRPAQFRALKAAEFGRIFDLPGEGEIVGSFPDLDWARKERAAIDRVRGSEPRPRQEDAEALTDQLVAQMVATETLQRSGENRWFRASAQITFRYVEEALQSLVAAAKDASPEGRRAAHDGAEKIRSKWTQALAKLPRDFLLANAVNERPKILSGIMDQFPVDLDELDKLDVDACLAADDPDAALERMISDLARLREQQGARLSKESSRKLLTELLAAVAVRDLLAGKSPEEIARQVQEIAKSLAAAGGPVDPARWGPKIEKIFASVR